MLRSLLAVLLASVCLSAQVPQKARSYFVDDYVDVVAVDFVKIREWGIWDEVESSMLKFTFSLIEEQAGFGLDSLDRMTITFHLAPNSTDAVPVPMRELTVLEGNAEWSFADEMESTRYKHENVAGVEVLRDSWGNGEVTVQINPKLRVSGPEDLIMAVVRGKARSGLPGGDVMSFLANKKNLLAYMVSQVTDGALGADVLAKVFPDTKWPEDDRPTFVCLRLSASGDIDDPHLILDGVIRHGKQGDGIAVSEAAVKAGIDKLLAMPEVRILKPMLKKIVGKRVGTDAVWRVDLGRTRNAVGSLALAGVPFMYLSRGEAVEEVAADAQPPQEPKPPRKKEPEQKKAKGGKQKQEQGKS